MSNIILCADDSKTMQTVAEITFRVSDYQYIGAFSADEALQKAKEEKPALILADAVMPGKTGYDLCKAVKSDAQLSDVPVIMLCGNSAAYDSARGSEVGADGHLTKPWDTQVMLDKVAEFLDKLKSTKAAAPTAAAKPVTTRPVTTKPPILPRSPAKTPTPTAPTPPPAAAGKAVPAADNRTNTIMGMPSGLPPAAKLPMSKSAVPPPPGFENRVPSLTATPKPTPVQAEKAPPATAKPAAPTPAKYRAPNAKGVITRPGIPKPPRPATPEAPAASPPTRAATSPPVAAKPPPARATPPISRRSPLSAEAAGNVGEGLGPAGSAGIDRPPMIRGIPTRRPTLQGRASSAAPAATPPARQQVAAKVATATSSAVKEVASQAGLDPNGPEMRALLALSRDVVERVVWEVVPDLAETIIRENLDQLVKR